MDRLNKYPSSDTPVKLISLDSKGAIKFSLTVEDSGLHFEWYHNTAWRVVVYSDELTGKTYRVFATAWEINGGLRIQKALYIDNRYQYEGAKTLLKDARDNALFNMVASTEKAVANMLAHAEIVVKAKALHDRAVIEMGGDAEYNAWIDGLKN